MSKKYFEMIISLGARRAYSQIIPYPWNRQMEVWYSSNCINVAISLLVFKISI